MNNIIIATAIARKLRKIDEQQEKLIDAADINVKIRNLESFLYNSTREYFRCEVRIGKKWIPRTLILRRSNPKDNEFVEYTTTTDLRWNGFI